MLKAIERGGRLELDERYWRDKDSRVADIIRRKSSIAGVSRGLMDAQTGRTMSLDEFEVRLRKRVLGKRKV